MKILLVVVTLVLSSSLLAYEVVELSLCDKKVDYTLTSDSTEPQALLKTGVICKNYCKDKPIMRADKSMAIIADCSYEVQCQQDQQSAVQPSRIDNKIKRLIIGEAYFYSGKLYHCKNP